MVNKKENGVSLLALVVTIISINNNCWSSDSKYKRK